MLAISVVVNTFKRPNKLLDCVRAILKNNFKNFEIIIIEQQGKGKLKEELKGLKNKNIFYFNLKKKGASLAKNFGIKRAKGEIIAFIDDDCKPARNWLINIYRGFQKNKETAAIFGRVRPYNPRRHKGLLCPCFFDRKEKGIITAPCRHWKKIGFGNNMVFRKDIFEKIGGFKEWLGPGSLALAAEDAEICYRLLSRGYKILYDPQVLVYHDRWLKKDSFEWKKQMRFYQCGEMAAYGFYAFQGSRLAQEVVREHFRLTFRKVYFQFKKAIKNLSFRILCEAVLDSYYDLRGILIGFWFAKF